MFSQISSKGAIMFDDNDKKTRRFFLKFLPIPFSLLLTSCEDNDLFDKDSKDTNGEYLLKLITSLSSKEKIELAKSLNLFPALEKKDFEKYGLPSYDNFVDNLKMVDKIKKLRPKSFNEVLSSVVEDAILSNRIDKQLISPIKIVNQLIWYSSNTFAYPFKSSTCNYHEIVQWVASKKGVNSTAIKDFSTFKLEQEIQKKYLEGIWDNLTKEQRIELLKEIEKQTDSKVGDYVAIAGLSGSAALAALATTVGFTGFAFYTTMASVICFVGGLAGVTFPFVVYTTASYLVAVLSGPVGWVIAGTTAAGSTIWLNLANSDKAAGFVMALNIIKAERLKKAGKL